MDSVVEMSVRQKATAVAGTTMGISSLARTVGLAVETRAQRPGASAATRGRLAMSTQWQRALRAQVTQSPAPTRTGTISSAEQEARAVATFVWLLAMCAATA